MLTDILIPAAARERVSGQRRLLLAPGINLLVGPNGSGKSTVLRALTRDDGWSIKYDRPTAFSFFDTEKMNPRLSPEMRSVLDITSHFASHGQVMEPILTTGLKQALRAQRKASPEVDWVGLVDEPEAGLDHRALMKFRQLLLDVQRQPHTQMIVATHSPLLWVLPKVRLVQLVDGYVAKVLGAWRRELHG